MSKRTVCTCDLCGKDTEPVTPISLWFGKINRDYSYHRAIYYSPKETPQESLTGDACNTCLRKFIEDIRGKYFLRYNVHE